MYYNKGSGKIALKQQIPHESVSVITKMSTKNTLCCVYMLSSFKKCAQLPIAAVIEVETTRQLDSD